MVSTFTPNIQLEEPARNDDVGVWDTPVNSNMSLIDLVAGSNIGIALNNSPVVLSAAQFRSNQLIFTSTLTGNVTITFPTSFIKPYAIENRCTGSSAFTITLATTAGGSVICAPPGEIVDITSDGASLRYKNLGRVGSLMDWGGSSVPAWISGCTIPPYLNCDATSFSSAVYPTLATILGGTTLPDIRGTTRYALNQGTGRITTANAGLDGNTNLSIKGTPTQTIGQTHLPSYTLAVNIVDPGHSHTAPGGFDSTSGAPGATFMRYNTTDVSPTITKVNATGITASAPSGGSGTAFPVIGTGTVVGITMIRAG